MRRRTDPAVVAPITTFIAAFNKGDVAGAAATHAAVADLVIVDEVAPYAWHGAKAFHAWAADLRAADAKHGITDQKVVLGAPTRVEVEGRQRLRDRAGDVHLLPKRRRDARRVADDVRPQEGRQRLADPRLDVDRAETDEGRREVAAITPSRSRRAAAR